VRFPDPSCNGYLAFAALMMAGLDGIERKIDPGQPLDRDIYGLSPKELADVPSTPASLEEALRALEADHDFLLRGDVFTEDALDMWVSYKREREAKPLSQYPTAMEFAMYYDI
jgi:glutamine synthetase